MLNYNIENNSYNSQEQIKIVGLENFYNPRYHIVVNNIINQIFANKDTITIKDLKDNSVFNELLGNINYGDKPSLLNAISELTGNDIDKNEMHVIYCLLDLTLEKNCSDSKEEYILDTKVEIKESTGLFKIKKVYDFDMLKNVYKEMKKIPIKYSALFENIKN